MKAARTGGARRPTFRPTPATGGEWFRDEGEPHEAGAECLRQRDGGIEAGIGGSPLI